jgi:hypothetical protein
VTESLFGIPIINQPLSLKFSNWLEGVFDPIGANGVPDASETPMEAYRYLKNQDNLMKLSVNQKPLVRLADKDLNVVATISEEMSCEVEELMSDSGKAKCVLRYNNWLAPYITQQNNIFNDLHLLVDPIPTQPTWKTRWGGKITEVNVTDNPDGTSTVTLQAISMREHVKRLLFAANPVFPAEYQLPRMWVLPGPIRSILFVSMFINLARIFVPGLSGITNAFNPVAWLNPLGASGLENLNPLSWPLQVAFVNPITDQSRWSALGATWTDWHSSTTDMLSDAGVVLRAYTFLTTDEDSPQTELTDLISGKTDAAIDLLDILHLDSLDSLVNLIGNDLTKLTRPTRNCVVFALEDQSGQTGPTGTALDGLLNLISVTGDDLITATLVEANTGETLNGEPILDASEPTAPVLQALVGEAPAPPKVIWRDGQFTGMIKRQVNLHKGPVLTTMTGGRSPTIVNETQDFAIKYGLAQLSDAINLAIGATINFTPASYTWQTPGTPGLDNLYQGQLDNTLFAWERYTDPVRAVWCGDLVFQEYFERGSSTAYTLSGFLSLREGNYKTAPFYGFQTEVMNGYPWAIDLDVSLGERAGFEMDGIIYVDQITAVKRTYDRKTPLVVSMSIGDDRDKHDPIAQAIRVMQTIYTTVSALFGEGTIFG